MNAADDDDNFGEDECTIEFGDEEPTPNSPDLSSPYLRSSEFQGEDYSKYLQDDDDDPPAPASPDAPVRRRYIKHTQGLRKSRPVTPPPPKERPVEIPYMPEIPPPDYYESSSSSPAARRKSIDTIRNRLGRFLTTIGSGRSKRSRRSQENSAPSSLHNFTFADSKLGMMVAAQQQEAARRSPPDSLETSSDLGGYTARRQSWWDVGTLSSARSIPLSDHSSIESSRSRRRQRKKSSSTPNLRDSNNDEATSVISSTSSTSRKQRSSSDGNQPVSNDARRQTDSTSRPPPPPPLRPTPSRGTGEGSSATKLTGFLRRLTDGIPKTSNSRRSRSEIGDQSPVVSQARYSRTYEEIPVRL